MFRAHMPCIVFSVLAIIACTSFVDADTSDSYDILNEQAYGNCMVWTAVDMFTDEALQHLECSQESSSDMTSVKVTHQSGGLSIVLSKGIMLSHAFSETAIVAYRVDKGELIKGEWQYGDYEASRADNHLATTLLNELAEGKRIAVQVGDERGNVVLDGAAEAVADFKSRVQP